MTPPERDKRYADLAALAGDNDPAQNRLIDRLDQALRPQPAPPDVYTALARLLRERSAASQTPARQVRQAPGALSRRTALKAAAASMTWLLTLGHTGPAVVSALAHFAK